MNLLATVAITLVMLSLIFPGLAMASRRRTRFCNHDLTQNVTVNSLTHKHVAVVNLNSSEIKLFVDVSWEATIPEGFELDGFLYHFDDPLLGVGQPSEKAINVCDLGDEYFWLKTNDSSCLNAANLTCNESIPGDLRICRTDYISPEFQPIIESSGQSPNCRKTGSTLVQVSHLGGFFSVPPNIRTLRFEVKFFEPYLLRVLAYYREFVHEPNLNDASFNFQIPFAHDCADIVRNSTNLGINEVTNFCTCEAGIPQLTARNLTFDEFKISFQNDSVEVDIFWLPPLNATGLNYFSVQHFLVGDRINSNLPKDINTTIPLSEADQMQLPSCDQTKVKYTAKLKGLRPDNTYGIEIESKYDRKGKLCDSGQCRITKWFKIPAINPCDEELAFCTELANCTAIDVTGATTLSATCDCPVGYDGNGVRSKQDFLLANGCIDRDHCHRNLTPCVSTAACTDFQAPTSGAICECFPGYFGDGLKEGNGCTHILVVVLSITIPGFILLAIVAAVIIRRIYQKRRRRDELKWEQFVSNDAFRGLTVLNLMDSEDNGGVWMPTFGDKWEIDRTKLRVSDVIGRGNYGIVHRGYYDFEDGNGEWIEAPVAIKTVKDGADEEFRLKEFLAEIGFMINIGDHPNVLKVFGCCTTQKPIYLITDYLKYGDLLHFLWDAREPGICAVDPIYHLSEKSLYQMARQVALGMDYLTKARIIHGDIAARNILVGENLICKISDFGLANDVYRYGIIQGQAERCVPFKWISPERMMAGEVPITSKSDVWSFGNLLYEMITLGCMPHSGVETHELLEKLKNGYRMKQPSTCSKTMYGIMNKCWKWRPSSRPSFSALANMLEKATESTKDIDYVNLAEIVMDDVTKEDDSNEEKRQSWRSTKKDLDEVQIEINGVSNIRRVDNLI